MGAGGRQNYAQAAMQTLFGEQLRQLENQAAQPTEVNQELVEHYTPQSTSVGNTVQDVLKRYTEGTGEATQSKDISTGLANLQKKIDDERDKLSGLTVTETSTRMVPQYEMMRPNVYTGPGPAPSYQGQIVSKLPEGAALQQGQYGQSFYQAPYTGPGPAIGAPNTNPTYRQVGSKKVTDTNVRDAIAGDPVYDKQQKLINALQGQYDIRSKYASPGATGIQGLIADPVASQPQTGYNINNILKRYVG
jgi:hypothetical protein